MKRILTMTLVGLLALVSIGCQVVSGGQYTLIRGETVSGNLVVFGGDSTLEQGSTVTGSLWVTGGNINANGQVDGDVSVSGGNINFGPSAVVRGSMQRTGGSVNIAEGASIQGGRSVAVRNAGRLAGTLAFIVILLPLLLVIAAIALLTLRSSRGTALQSATSQGPTDAVLSPSGPSVPAGRGSGLGSTLVLGVVLIGLGVLFLLEELLNLDVWHYAWPFLILVPGLLCFGAMVLGGRNAGTLAIPGSILTMLGLIFLYQNSFNLFESWAYAWALIFPTSVGIGRYIEGSWSDRPALRENGLRETRTGLIIFLILAAFFELVLNLSGYFFGDLSRFAFPALLILVGVLLLVTRFFNWHLHRPSGTATLSSPPPTGKDPRSAAQS